MSLAPMTPDEIREKAQDFTAPFYFEYSLVVYKKPDKSSLMNMYLLPFKPNVSNDIHDSSQTRLIRSFCFD